MQCGGGDCQVTNLRTASGIDIAAESDGVTGVDGQVSISSIGTDCRTEGDIAVIGSNGAGSINFQTVLDGDRVVRLQVGGQQDVGVAAQVERLVCRDVGVDVERARVCIECGTADSVLGRRGDVEGGAGDRNVIAADIGANIDDRAGAVGVDRNAAGQRLNILADRDRTVGVEIDVTKLATDAADGADGTDLVGVERAEGVIFLSAAGQGRQGRGGGGQVDDMAAGKEVVRDKVTTAGVGQRTVVAVVEVGRGDHRTGCRGDDGVDQNVGTAAQGDGAGTGTLDIAVDRQVIVVAAVIGRLQGDVAGSGDTGYRYRQRAAGDDGYVGTRGVGAGSGQGAGVLDVDDTGGIDKGQCPGVRLDGVRVRADAFGRDNVERRADDVHCSVVGIGDRNAGGIDIDGARTGIDDSKQQVAGGARRVDEDAGIVGIRVDCLAGVDAERIGTGRRADRAFRDERDGLATDIGIRIGAVAKNVASGRNSGVAGGDHGVERDIGAGAQGDRPQRGLNVGSGDAADVTEMDVASRRGDGQPFQGVSIDGMAGGTDVAGGVDGHIVGGDQAVAIAVGDVLTGCRRQCQHDIPGTGASVDGADLGVAAPEDSDRDVVDIIISSALYIGDDDIADGAKTRDNRDEAVRSVDVEQLDTVFLDDRDGAGTGYVCRKLCRGRVHWIVYADADTGSKGHQSAGDQGSGLVIGQGGSGRLKSHIAGAGSDGGHRQGAGRGGDADRVVRRGHAGQNDIAGGRGDADAAIGHRRGDRQAVGLLDVAVAADGDGVAGTGDGQAGHGDVERVVAGAGADRGGIDDREVHRVDLAGSRISRVDNGAADIEGDGGSRIGGTGAGVEDHVAAGGQRDGVCGGVDGAVDGQVALGGDIKRRVDIFVGGEDGQVIVVRQYCLCLDVDQRQGCNVGDEGVAGGALDHQHILHTQVVGSNAGPRTMALQVGAAADQKDIAAGHDTVDQRRLCNRIVDLEINVAGGIHLVDDGIRSSVKYDVAGCFLDRQPAQRIGRATGNADVERFCGIVGITGRIQRRVAEMTNVLDAETEGLHFEVGQVVAANVAPGRKDDSATQIVARRNRTVDVDVALCGNDDLRISTIGNYSYTRRDGDVTVGDQCDDALAAGIAPDLVVDDQILQGTFADDRDVAVLAGVDGPVHGVRVQSPQVDVAVVIGRDGAGMFNVPGGNGQEIERIRSSHHRENAELDIAQAGLNLETRSIDSGSGIEIHVVIGRGDLDVLVQGDGGGEGQILFDRDVASQGDRGCPVDRQLSDVDVVEF